ncbi:MAG TPA: PIG-L deacetylase family protein [Jatrophihabitans sp.]
MTCALHDIIAVGQRLVVVAPHPDDETIGPGGLIHDAVRAGRDVLVVGVTDGRASHPGSQSWPVLGLIEQRRFERSDALHCLGVATADVRELGIADGGVRAAIDDVFGQLRVLLEPEDVVVSPWRYDGHPDHEATAVASERAAAAVGARHLQVPIWGWHWADPDSSELPIANVLIYPLDDDAHAAKTCAVDCFTSQLTPDASTHAGPILPDWALRRMLRRQEVLLR